VTLLLESFRSPEASAVAAIDHAAQATVAPAVYVLLGAHDDGSHNDRETLLARESIKGHYDSLGASTYETTSQLLGRRRLHGFHYRALHILATYRPGNQAWTDSNRRAALRAAQNFYTAAHPRNVPALDTYFLPPLLDALGIDWAVPKGRWEDRIASDVAPPKPAEPVWESETPPPQRQIWVRRTSGYCAKHGCQRNECLCWD